MTTTDPFFSVITVTHNNLDGLRRTAASLTAQDSSDYEWIVIDGASRDGTSAFMAHRPAHFISEPDRGIYDAMNKGISRARGTYLIFMNAGDSFAAGNTLSRIHHELHERMPDFIYGDALETLPSGGLAYKKSRAAHKYREGMITHHQSMLYRRAVIENMRFDLRYAVAADFDFTLQFMEKSAQIARLDFPVCVFEPGGLSQRQCLRGRREQFRVRARHRCPMWKNTGVFMLQSCLWALRATAPAVYWKLKARY